MRPSDSLRRRVSWCDFTSPDASKGPCRRPEQRTADPPLSRVPDTTMRGMWRGRWRRGVHLTPSWRSICEGHEATALLSQARLVHAIGYAARVYGRRLARIHTRCGGGFCRRSERRGEQPGRERPHLRRPDPDPRIGHGVAHIPAACLRSCDGFRTPMSRTIDWGSDRKNTRQSGARFVTIRDRLSEAMTRRCHRRSGVTSLLLVVRRSLPIAFWIFMRCSAASNSRGRPLASCSNPSCTADQKSSTEVKP